MCLKPQSFPSRHQHPASLSWFVVAHQVWKGGENTPPEEIMLVMRPGETLEEADAPKGLFSQCYVAKGIIIIKFLEKHLNDIFPSFNMGIYVGWMHSTLKIHYSEHGGN